MDLDMLEEQLNAYDDAVALGLVHEVRSARAQRDVAQMEYADCLIRAEKAEGAVASMREELECLLVSYNVGTLAHTEFSKVLATLDVVKS